MTIIVEILNMKEKNKYIKIKKIYYMKEKKNVGKKWIMNI